MARKPIKVFFFGDSICFGQYVSPYKTWTTRISAQLGKLEKAYHRQILVVNASINGCTTRQALERMPYDVQSHAPQVILVQYGMNDCNVWETDRGHPRVSQSAFAANLTEIVGRARIFGARRVFLNTNHPSGHTRRNLPFCQYTYEQANRCYNQIIREVATKLSPLVLLTDMEKVFLERVVKGVPLARLLHEDLLHLGEGGHQLYYAMLKPKVVSAVRELLEHGRRI
jgi:lysophospholipase L1-like esterase